MICEILVLAAVILLLAFLPRTIRESQLKFIRVNVRKRDGYPKK